ERGDHRPPCLDELTGAGPEDNWLGRAVAKIVGGGRDVSLLEPRRHGIDARGPEDREYPGGRVEHRGLGPLGFVVGEIVLVIVSTRHGDEAADVGTTT